MAWANAGPGAVWQPRALHTTADSSQKAHHPACTQPQDLVKGAQGHLTRKAASTWPADPQSGPRGPGSVTLPTPYRGPTGASSPWPLCKGSPPQVTHPLLSRWVTMGAQGIPTAHLSSTREPGRIPKSQFLLVQANNSQALPSQTMGSGRVTGCTYAQRRAREVPPGREQGSLPHALPPRRLLRDGGTDRREVTKRLWWSLHQDLNFLHQSCFLGVTVSGVGSRGRLGAHTSARPAVFCPHRCQAAEPSPWTQPMPCTTDRHRLLGAWGCSASPDKTLMGVVSHSASRTLLTHQCFLLSSSLIPRTSHIRHPGP